MVKLDARLSAIAELVRTDKRICDVGTDHALLPCFLYERGARDIIASDINEKPLAAAKATVEQYGCGDIRLVLSDGLKNIPPRDDVIIAGMGGELIARIMSECSFVTPDVRFILQPMTRAEVLRRWLYGAGYEIILENGAFAGGKAYTVMLCSFIGEKADISDSFAFFGKNTDPRYISKVNSRLRKLAHSDPSLLDIIREETI